MKDCEEIIKCIACGHDVLIPVLDLKHQPLANSFKNNDNEPEDFYPLAINHCEKCYHVQLTHRVHPDLLFKNYLYVSGTSKTQLEYFDWFAKFTIGEVTGKAPKNVLDIGCNDGSQLDAFKKYGLETVGVDPAENLHIDSSKRHNVICGYFNEQTFEDTVFDIITCQNAFAHNYNPLQFLENVKTVMDSTSLLYITTSQANMIGNNEFDTIYHEHISFYNIKSMNELCKRAGLFLNDVVKHPIHGTSYIFIISKHFSRPYNIEKLIADEESACLYDAETYKEYAKKCNNIISGFKTVIDTIRNNGYSIIGYGASAKGNTLMNASQANPDFIIDDAPLKQGMYTPGRSVPILGINILNKFIEIDRLCFIPLAWNFYDEIKRNIQTKREGKDDMFVSYFPKIEVENPDEVMHHRV